ncbi:unnamed protein product [Trichobilharzia regenti]|nr:unnamed protein product [Trichobilharzia regenti]
MSFACILIAPFLLSTFFIFSFQSLSTVLGQVQACLECEDPVGLRSGIILFLQLIQSAGHDTRFYEDFLLLHFIPFCILAPISPAFHTTDGQFILILDKISECLYILSQKQVSFFLLIACHAAYIIIVTIGVIIINFILITT